MICQVIPDSFHEYEPYHAIVFFYSFCNMHCQYCYNYDFVMDKKNIISKDFKVLCKKYITPMHEAVVLLGGEPCLHDIKSHCFYIKENYGLKIKLFTNGTFPEKVIELCEIGLLDAISLDVKTLKHSELIKYPIDKYKVNISKLLNYLKDKSNIETECRTTIPKDFKLDLDDIKQFLNKFPFRHILQEDERKDGRKDL